MEFIPIKISQQGQHPHSELSFKSDCTEIKHIAIDRWYGQITTIQTYCSQDVSKEQNLIFPTKIIKFFKLLSSSEFGRRFWFDDCSRGTFNEAGIDTNYDADVGDIFSGDSKSDFMRYIYRDMVLPFKKLEKENKHLREQLESKDQEIERKDQELAQMKKQLESKDQELKEKDQEASTLISDILLMDQELKEKDRELERKDQELAQMKEQLESKDQEMEQQLKELQENLKTKDQELQTGLLTASTLKYVIEVNCDKLEEKDQKLKNIQEELENIQEELDTTYQELKELQEILETTDQELETKDQELETRGMLLKTLTEEIEKVEKKNQALEHLNHRLICETSSFVKKNSYFNFSPEM